jgi:hypothetical protein
VDFSAQIGPSRRVIRPGPRVGNRGIPDALNEICGQFDGVQRSLIFIYVGPERGPVSLTYRLSTPRASRDQIDASVAKGGLLTDLYGLWIHCPLGRLVSNL